MFPWSRRTTDYYTGSVDWKDAGCLVLNFRSNPPKLWTVTRVQTLQTKDYHRHRTIMDLGNNHKRQKVYVVMQCVMSGCCVQISAQNEQGMVVNVRDITSLHSIHKPRENIAVCMNSVVQGFLMLHQEIPWYGSQTATITEANSLSPEYSSHAHICTYCESTSFHGSFKSNTYNLSLHFFELVLHVMILWRHRFFIMFDTLQQQCVWHCYLGTTAEWQSHFFYICAIEESSIVHTPTC